LSYFVVAFAILLACTAEPKFGIFYTTIAFIIGGFTSIISGYIGMRIAVYTNVRTTKECAQDIHNGFIVAYRGGQVLGFVLVGLALLVLQILIIAYQKIYLNKDYANYEEKVEDARVLFEMISGYGLGGSTVALFGRVGGGIYTKAADVGSDLAGKVVQGLEEDDPSNPGVIADNVGDNVGDIAGMGADLFGSLAESTCAALVVGATSRELLEHHNAMYFPLMITAVGILVSFVTSFFATVFTKVKADNVESTVKWQLIISTVLMTGAVIPLIYFLPETFTFGNKLIPATYIEVTQWKAFGCIAAGLWSGFIIGWITEVYTSNAYSPVQELAEACRMGAAPNIILGLALGYMSTIIPILCIAVTIYISFTFAGMYGIALAALGMLGCLPIQLAIDGYGPISDNAGGIAEMTGLHPSVRKATDKLDAAGNTTAAIGKGFAIGSACLVALALFGAYVTRTKKTEVNILRPLEFSGLLIGAMLPYAFSALTMAAVGNAANQMIAEIKRQFQGDHIRNGGEPDYEKCIAISTKASIRMMIAPGLLVIGSPFVVGVLFGADGVSGLLAGAIVSGVQIATSFSNSGGAWDNAKKYIEAGTHQSKHHLGDTDEQENNGKYVFKKHSDAHKAAVIGDTVGDPLKDTSGPSINILIKLSAITSLVFGTFFLEKGGVLLK
jgi:H+-translocating diphosphatase